MAKINLSIIGIMDHPDICGVISYLEQHRIIPPNYGDLMFAIPTGEDYDDQLDWFFSKASVMHVVPNGTDPIQTWAAYDHEGDTIIVLADCCEHEDEVRVADYYLGLFAENGYEKNRVRVIYTQDDDPVDYVGAVFDDMDATRNRPNDAEKVLKKAFPDVDPAFMAHSFHKFNDGSMMHEVQFEYLEKSLVLRFEVGPNGKRAVQIWDGTKNFDIEPDDFNNFQIWAKALKNELDKCPFCERREEMEFGSEECHLQLNDDGDVHCYQEGRFVGCFKFPKCPVCGKDMP